MKERIPSKYSDNLYFLKFLLAVGIVYLHSTNFNDFGVAATMVEYVEKICFNITQICVPFFFFIAGYLYFRSFEMHSYQAKIGTKLHTLLVPYLLWNFIFGIYYLGITWTGFHHPDSPLTVTSWLLNVVNSGYSVLWFIKYLMIMMLASPVYFYFMKDKRSGALMLFALMFFVALNYGNNGPVRANDNSIFNLCYYSIFFCSGGFISYHFSKQIENLSDDFKNRNSTALYRGGVNTCVLAAYVILLTLVAISPFGTWMWIIRLLFISLSMMLLSCVNFKMHKVYRNRIFIYCAHLLLLQPAMKVCSMLFSGSVAIAIISYFVLPLCIVILLVMVIKLCEAHPTKLWRLLN